MKFFNTYKTAALISLFFVGTIGAQNIAVSETKARLKADISFLASDQLAGRQTGSQGELASAEYIRKEFKKTEGEIWHHLEEYTDHKDILQRNGSWIKTDIKVWSKSFSKMSTKMKWGRSKEMSGEIYPRGITGIYSKDHCEVFFDEKV